MTSLFLLYFPPTILHIYTVKAIGSFRGSLLYYYFDNSASNIKLFWSEKIKVTFMENSYKKVFLGNFTLFIKNCDGNGSQEQWGKGQKRAEFISQKLWRIGIHREWNWLSFSILLYWHISCSVAQMIQALYWMCFGIHQVIYNHMYCACMGEREWEWEGERLWAYMHSKYNFIFPSFLHS